MKLGHVVILGAGVSGVAAARLAKSRGAHQIDIYDNAPADKLSAINQELSASGITLHPGEESTHLTALPVCDLIVFSPGIALSSPLGLLAQKNGAPCLGELGFAAQFCNLPIYAVTGTNGKTTTTELFTACLNAAGRHTVSGGNIGIPLSQIVCEGTDNLDCIVTEVSSFQMELPQGFSPDVALVLNITPDHINRHGSFEAYRAAKLHCVEQLSHNGHAVINADLSDCIHLASGVTATRFWMMKRPSDAPHTDLLVTSEGIFSEGASPLIRADELQLRGMHNLQNVAAVIGAMSAIGFPLEKYRSALQSFKAGHHRIELVSKINDVSFYDDSKATDVDALIQAIETLGIKNSPNIHLIAGGLDKGCSLTEVKPQLRMYVKDIALIGQCKQRLFNEWNSVVPCTLCDTMEGAVKQCFSCAQPKDIVLLSPGCASMDMFANYEERGFAFVKAVSSLSK